MKVQFLVLAVLLAIPFLGCHSNKKNDNETTTFVTGPKKLISDTTYKFIAMQDRVSKDEFDKIDQLIADKKLLSADTLLDQMMQRYISKGQWDGYVRAVMMKSRLLSFQESGLNKSINYLEEELLKAGSPARAVLYSVTANSYLNYLNGHIDRLGKVTSGSDDIDFSTWSVSQFLDKIHLYYAHSLADVSTKEIPIDAADLITTTSNTDSYAASLFDFLALQSLEFYENDIHSIDEPVYKFEIKGDRYFMPVNEFIHAEIPTRDSSSRVFQGLMVFRKLLEHQVRTDNEAGLHKFNLMRLNYVHSHSVDPMKDRQLLAALDVIIGRGEKKAWKAEYALKKITTLHSMDTYKTDEPEVGNVNYLVDIVNEYEKLMADYPNTNAAKKAELAIRGIKAPSLHLSTERIQIPAQPFLMLAQYTNVTKEALHIYAVSQSDFINHHHHQGRERSESLTSKQLVRTIPIQLTDYKDHRSHSAEFKVDALKPGFYFASFSGADNEEGRSSLTFFQVADLAVVQADRTNGPAEVFVVDRLSGAPVSGVKASVFEINYRQPSNITLQYITTSNDDGKITLKKASNKAQFITYEKGESALVDMNYFYQYQMRDYSYSGLQATFFLDRAIYRPGQLVHFKSIVYELKDRIPVLKANQTVSISLKDVNGQNVHSLSLRTNEFGSVHGSFSIPVGLLTGSMSLFIDNQYGIGFQVEEYKRPKFEVVLDTLKEAYVLKDEIQTGGVALNYAGSPVDGATVHYTVIRKHRQRFPIWREMFFFRIPPTGPEMVITNGTTTTDETGHFKVNFTAIPDEAYLPENNPTFIFDIQVDVTDINGETRSGSQQLQMGYRKFHTSFSLGMNTTAEQMKTLIPFVHNSTGAEMDVKGRLKIVQLKAPENYLRHKMYQTPQEVLLSREEYKKLWPYEPYLDELDMTQWPVLANLLDVDGVPANKQVDRLNTLQFRPGYYKVTFHVDKEVTSDEEGTTYIFIEGKSTNPVFHPSSLLSVGTDKTSYQPGDKAVVTIAGRNPSKSALYEFYVGNSMISREWLNLSAARRKVIEITEQFRGGVTANVMAYGYNRVESIPMQINVPWTNKELEVTLKTFRSKVEPGSRETWELQVSGPKKDVVAAEVLAGMYDASLDAFVTADYNKIGFPENYFQQHYIDKHNAVIQLYRQFFHDYPDLGITNDRWRKFKPELLIDQLFMSYSGMMIKNRAVAKSAELEIHPAQVMEEAADMAGGNEQETKEEVATQAGPAVRKNLEETVFFYPNLRTDAAGNVVLQFTMKEALTRWKMRVFAHTTDLKQGTLEQEVVTSKELMVFPNLPRYFRENDEVVLSAKVNNMSTESGTVTTRLELINAITNQPLDHRLLLDNSTQTTSITAGQSSNVQWRVKSPAVETSAVIVRITAQNANHTDGEENILTVLSNRMLVTETMPMPLRSGETRTFDFKSMLAAMASTTDQPYRFTLEYTANPVWYAIQALPYLMEYPHECTEQILNRYFANALASHVANSHPKIKAVFDQWRNSEALISNLEKNEELKAALLEETPWVLEAQSEAQQKKNIALLFDLNRMANEEKTAINKIIERQNYDGGMPWFPGGPSSDYMTSYVLENLGHMIRLGVLSSDDRRLTGFINNAITYCDKRMIARYEDLEKQLQKNTKSLSDDHLGYWEVQYLYARSFFGEADKTFKNTVAYRYYVGQSVKYWNKRNHYANGMMALYLHRNGDRATAAKIVEGLRQTAIQNDELGMYWSGPSGYFWYQLPIETQAMMIETFAELTDDKKSIEDMKLWLLKNKQTTHWKTTKGTSAAIYALMMTGGSMSLETVLPSITLGEKALDISQYVHEAGTGYFKMTETGADILQDMARVTITNHAPVVNWGAAYYQYFEQLDKVQLFKETPLSISKTYHRVEKGDRGEILRPLNEGQTVKVGDKIRVRTVIRVDRPMEYVHLKDMRPAGLEPINTLSGYRFRNGLGYYESTQDVASHFFIDYLPAGTFVFEYDLRANLRGDYSTGISTIQSMYAPEFSSHSEGGRMVIR